jgi:predicted N-acetyltransferase YhbS
MTPGPGGLRWRRLGRDEIGLLWEIDRSEVIERIFELRDGELVARDERFDMRGWPPGEPEAAMPWLEASFERGAIFIGVFDGPKIVGAAVIDTVPLGRRRDLVQLSFLHVGASHRGRGLGRALFAEAGRVATELGASGLYVSATPSEHTISFYLARGCRVTDSPDPELLRREPEDIHFECPIGAMETQ